MEEQITNHKRAPGGGRKSLAQHILSSGEDGPSYALKVCIPIAMRLAVEKASGGNMARYVRDLIIADLKLKGFQLTEAVKSDQEITQTGDSSHELDSPNIQTKSAPTPAPPVQKAAVKRVLPKTSIKRDIEIGKQTRELCDFEYSEETVEAVIAHWLVDHDKLAIGSGYISPKQAHYIPVWEKAVIVDLDSDEARAAIKREMRGVDLERDKRRDESAAEVTLAYQKNARDNEELQKRLASPAVERQMQVIGLTMRLEKRISFAETKAILADLSLDVPTININGTAITVAWDGKGQYRTDSPEALEAVIGSRKTT